MLTTDELARLLKAAGIDLKNLPDSEPDSPLGDYTGAGVIFGVTGGVTEAVIRRVLDDASPEALKTIAECGVRGLEGIKAFTVTAGDLSLKIAVANGLGNADKLIEKVQSGEEYFDFIEVMACPNGCIGGGGQPPASNARKRERMERRCLRAQAPAAEPGSRLYLRRASQGPRPRAAAHPLSPAPSALILFFHKTLCLWKRHKRARCKIIIFRENKAL